MPGSSWRRSERLSTPPSWRRLVLGLLVAVAGPFLAVAFTDLGWLEGVPTIPFLIVVVVASTLGRLLAGLVAALVSVVLMDLYVLPPLHTFRPETSGDVVELAFFLGLALLLADLIARRELSSGLSALVRRRLRFVGRAGDILSASPDLERSMGELARHLVWEMADRCAVHLVDDQGELRNVASARAVPGGAGLRETTGRLPADPLAEAWVVEVIRTGRAELHRGTRGAPLEGSTRDPKQLRAIRELGLRSVAIAPMSAHGTTFGTITLATAESGRILDQEDLLLLEEIGDKAGLAIENAHLYEAQRHIASTLQQGLLPQGLPNIAGLEFAARYWPLGETNLVGGDFYDVVPTGEGRWTAVVGDVCGKGPEAAVVMGIARQTVRNLAAREPRPSDLIRAVNAALLDRETAGRFCTMVAARIVVDERGVRATVASGGHPLPFLLGPHGEVRDVGRHGTLLGIFDHIEVVDDTVELPPGASLILYTDGLTEPAPGSPGGSLAKALSEQAGMDAEGIAKGVQRDTHPSFLRDDAALLVIHRVEVSEAQGLEPVGELNTP
ncbi:MAG: SpoIIE family protein phosphatase [Actinomycetota bacterium]